LPRQVLTQRGLVTRLNEELAAGVHCCDNIVSEVMRVEKDDSGCNWSISVMSCFGSFSSAGNREAERVIKSMQSLYNLAEGSVISPIQFRDASNTTAST